MPSAIKWKRIQYKVWLRDNYRCIRCGSSRRLCVHHKDGSGDLKRNAHSNNDLSNLITICQSCHGKEHWIEARRNGYRNIISIDRFDKEEPKYDEWSPNEIKYDLWPPISKL